MAKFFESDPLVDQPDSIFGNDPLVDAPTTQPSVPQTGITRQQHFQSLKDKDIYAGKRTFNKPLNPVQASDRANKEFDLSTERGITLQESQKQVATEGNLNAAKETARILNEPAEGLVLAKQGVVTPEFRFTKGENLIDAHKAELFSAQYGTDMEQTLKQFNNIRSAYKMYGLLGQYETRNLERDIDEGISMEDAAQKYNHLPMEVVGSAFAVQDLVTQNKNFIEDLDKTITASKQSAKSRAFGKSLMSIPVIGDIARLSLSVGGKKASLAFKSAGEEFPSIDKVLGLEEFGERLFRDAEGINQGAFEDVSKGRRMAGGISESLVNAYFGSIVGGTSGVIQLFMAETQQNAYYEARDAGFNEASAMRYAGNAALIEGGITTMFSAVGAGGLESAVGKTIRGGTKQFLKTLGKDVIAELTEEELIEFLQALNEKKAGIDPNALTVERFADVAIQTIITMGLVSGISKVTSPKDTVDEKLIRDTEKVSQKLNLTPDEMQDVLTETKKKFETSEQEFNEVFKETLSEKVEKKNGIEAEPEIVEDKLKETPTDALGETISPETTTDAVIEEQAVTEPLKPTEKEIAPVVEKAPPQERPLPKTAGQAKIIAAAAAEIGTIAETSAEKIKGIAKSVKSLSGKLVQRATTRFTKLGESGKQVSGDLKEIAFRSQKNANVDIADTNVVLHGVSHKNRILVSQAINKRVALNSLPKWLQPKVAQMRKILDRSLKAAQGLGVQRRVKGQKIDIAGSGKAYPQALNTKGQKLVAEARAKGPDSQKVFDAAQKIVDSGQAKDIPDAITKIQQFSDQQLRGLNRYLEATRIELPPEFIEWDIQKVLPNLVEGNWLTLEAIRQWDYDQAGQSFPKANELIEKIKSEQGTDASKEVEDFIKFSFGAEKAPTDIARLSHTIRGAQFVSKVALSPLTIIRNMLDRGVKGLTIGDISTNVKATALYPPFLNKWIKESQRIENDMIRAGAISGHGAISADVEAGQRTAVAIGKPFSSSERGNQVFIALVRKLQMEKDLAKLVAKHNQNPKVKKFLNRVDAIMGNSEKQLRYRLEKETLDFDTITTESLVDEWVNNGGQVSEEQFERILHRAVRDKTFPVILSTKRSWWDKSPLMRVFAQFKTWPVEQTAHIYNDVLKYTLKTGDPSRLARWMAGTAIAGELYNMLRDFLFDKDESVTKKIVKGESADEIMLAIANDFLDGGGVGMFADFSYGLTNWAVGVSGNSLKNLKRFTTDLYDNPSNAADAFGQLAENESSSIRQVRAVLTKLDQQDNAGSVAQEYWPARSKAFDWRDDKQFPTTTKKIGKALKEFLGGRPTFTRTAKTLSYDLAARQVIVGDIDDAAKHLGRILDDVDIKNVDDITDVIKGIKGSADSKSPLGPVNDEDMEEFLKTVPDVGEVTQAQADWTKAYNEAIVIAAGSRWDKNTPGMKDYLGKLAKKLSGNSINKTPLERQFIIDFAKAMGASLDEMNQYLAENMDKVNGVPVSDNQITSRNRALTNRSNKMFTDWNRK